MGKLLALTAYALDATQYASASPMTIQADNITITRSASLAQKQSNPAASASINTAVYANYRSENEGQSHVILVSETQAALVTAS